MPDGFEHRIEELFAEYERRRSGLSELQQRMEAIRGTALSKRRELSVTAAHNGVVTEIRFLTGAYKRMPPQELAALLMETIAEAKDAAAEQAAEVLTPLLPPGIDPKALAGGRLGADDLVPPRPRIPQVVREHLRS
jgi:hypothetical protein